MEIKTVKIENLIPYENNPRKNHDAVEYVAKSIKAFGFKVPIVIDKNNVIVCGHTRYLACKQLGYAEAPCIVADDLTDDQIRAFRLADNKVAEFSAWDDEILDNELEFLANLDLGFEMADFGFDLSFEDEPEEEEEQEEESLFDDIEKMEKHYGVPYQGNKSRIADIIIDILPGGKRLVDLFGGGGVLSRTVECYPKSGMRICTTI